MHFAIAVFLDNQFFPRSALAVWYAPSVFTAPGSHAGGLPVLHGGREGLLLLTPDHRERDHIPFDAGQPVVDALQNVHSPASGVDDLLRGVLLVTMENRLSGPLGDNCVKTETNIVTSRLQ